MYHMDGAFKEALESFQVKKKLQLQKSRLKKLKDRCIFLMKIIIFVSI